MSWTVWRLLMAATLRRVTAAAHRPDGLFAAVLRQPVLHGEQRRPGPRPAADLRIDVGHVVLDRPRRDDQAGGDLLVRHPAGEQPQDLDLALGQLAGVRAPARGRVARGGEYRLDRLGVEPAGVALGPQVARGGRRVERAAVR